MQHITIKIIPIYKDKSYQEFQFILSMEYQRQTGVMITIDIFLQKRNRIEATIYFSHAQV